MPRVFLPAPLRPIAEGRESVDLDAGNVGQVVDELEARYPGIRARLCDGDELKPELTVAVDGHVSGIGLLQKVQPTSEVHFLPAIGGG